MTSTAVMPNPLTVEQAIDDARAWIESPISNVLLPGPEHLHVMERLLVDAGRGGELTSAAQIA
ncbi:MAG: type II toxin-antitoxin system VapC family toxin, partial [Actinomycetota bacterium]